MNSKEGLNFIKKTGFIQDTENAILDPGVAVLYAAANIEQRERNWQSLPGKEIVADLLSGRRKRVVGYGAAGIGKSTFLGQLETLVTRLSEEKIRFTGVRYDEESAKCERDFGLLKKDWRRDHWAELNDRIIQQAKKRSMLTDDDSANRDVQDIISLEINGTGAVADRDRGVTALKEIVRMEKEEDRVGETLYVGITPNVQIQAHSVFNRRDVLVTPDELVPSLLESRKIHIVTGAALQGMTGAEIGRLLKALYRHMADPIQIEKINQENLALEKILVPTKEERAELAEKIFPRSAFWRRNLPVRAKLQNKTKHLGNFTYAHTEKVLKIPHEQRVLLYIPLIENGWIYWHINCDPHIYL